MKMLNRAFCYSVILDLFFTYTRMNGELIIRYRFFNFLNHYLLIIKKYNIWVLILVV